MNVLVYSGPEVLNTSFARATSWLKAILVPHYSVQPITLQSLTSNPWSDTCALLVIPACREQLSLPPAVRTGIKNYVEGGGSLLGLRASARVVGSGFASVDVYESSLRFQDRSSGTSVSCTFVGSASGNAVSVVLKSNQGDASFPADAAPAEFTVPENATNVQTLARYGADGESQTAGIVCRVGQGRVVLWGLDVTSAASQEIPDTERIRRALLEESLQQLGLKLPQKESSAWIHPLPQILTSSPASPSAVQAVIASLSSVQVDGIIKDEHDTFAFHTVTEGKTVLQEARNSPSSETTIKHIITYPDGQLPSREDTPLFNISQYYADLAAARAKATSLPPASWGIGEALLYGEVVTSTQTMLDKLSFTSPFTIFTPNVKENHRFLTALPSPLLSLASHQIAGRGRGGNNWVSPAGCLQFSLLLRIPLKDVPAQKLVFVQYLVALAVVEACRSPDVLGQDGERVRIKWPNDLYVVEGEKGEGKRKVGGILVHTSFQGGVTTIVIGCGVNVLNTPPVASLSQLGTPPRPLTMERTAATTMATFEPMWNTFVAERGPSRRSWISTSSGGCIHQLVTITSTTPHKNVRIVGITEDYGLLRTVPERGGGGGQQFVDLQPDGNSFDLMSGLIMSKSP
ncbi:biotin holocarboxylase synthetase [Steccherinum ochraceum]|uniref:Biotin holocarboxylase synthetase n=1 Tax=Steccherinum ochraceum TaxID=92696 RepID=A0A4R0RT11_9APHY|nr:biotin holocarboxylase synthetase [Steccherinum ochraceum]